MMTSGVTSRKRLTHQQLCYLLYLSGFLDLCGVGMLLALIPSRAREIGASTTVTGLIGSIYGGAQLLSSPVMGKWADSVSRKTSILLSLVVSSMGYFLMASSPSIYILCLARAVLGCFKHSQTLSKAYLADFLPHKERSAVLGRFNSFSNIGLILGPILGGHLAETNGGFSLVATGTAIFFLVNTCLVWFCVPHSDEVENGNSLETPLVEKEKSSKEKVAADMESKSSEGKDSSFVLFAFWDLFLIIFFGSFSMILYRSNFSLLLRENFLVSPKTAGYVTSYTGFISTVCGFTIGKITERYKNNDALLFRHVTTAQVFVLLCLSFSPSVPLLIVFLTPLSVITSIARVTTTSITIQRCGKDKLAAVMGWTQSVTSGARMMAPFVAGVAQEWSMDTACYISVLGVLISLGLMVIFPQGPQKDGKKSRD